MPTLRPPVVVTTGELWSYAASTAGQGRTSRPGTHSVKEAFKSPTEREADWTPLFNDRERELLVRLLSASWNAEATVHDCQGLMISASSPTVGSWGRLRARFETR